VCWLGGHRTLILEFPLPEAMSALLVRAFGEDPRWDRIVTLAFFLISTLYFHAFVRRIVSERTARLSTLAYLALPLAQYYSRAAHIDFAAIACAHGLLYHVARSSDSPSARHTSAATAWGVLGALIKGPYLLPILGPLVLVCAANPSSSSLAVSAIPLAATAVTFLVWRHLVDGINAQAPDWYFLPGYYKEANPLWWYVGTLAQRLDLRSWRMLVHHIFREVLTPLGAVLALIGGVWPRQAPTDTPREGLGYWTGTQYALVWLLGAGVGLLVFFPLNVIHNYYQLPFVAPVALLVGIGADRLWERLPRWRPLPAGALVFAAFLAFAMGSVVPLGYYRIDWLRVTAGREIATVVPRGDLIVASDFSSRHTDPRLLARADRAGWPLAIPNLTPARLDTLARLGARWVAVVTDPDHPALAPPAFLEPWRAARLPIEHDGRRLGELHVFRLDRRELERASAGEIRP
jgi:4-amino-4-deoxy-L-arabinose transferase-like glycosyltransferase